MQYAHYTARYTGKTRAEIIERSNTWMVAAQQQSGVAAAVGELCICG